MNNDDHRMIHHAATRSAVVVTVDGRPVDAILIAWKPKRSDGSRRRNVARVEFRSGRQLTVQPDRISVPL